MGIDPYRAKYAYGEDYGTRFFKYGILKEGRPRVTTSSGLFLEESFLLKHFGVEKKLVVGDEVSKYAASVSSLARNLVFPLSDGEVKRDDERAWSVIKELTRKGFEDFRGYTGSDFDGFYVTAAVSAIAPDYMYERLLKIHAEIDEKTRAVKAFTIIPQPLAVAIAEQETSCLVIESGHGNTQITPIRMYPIRDAIIALYRGGAEADAIAAEVLKDLGYGDLVSDEYAVRKFKEDAGLVPLDLDEAIKKAREDSSKLRTKVKLSALVEVDFEDKGWLRYLIGEVIFNPMHEIFDSYRKRGVLNIRDARLGEDVIEGALPLEDAIIRSTRKLRISIQNEVLSKIILSGGNFNWRVPENLKGIAVDAPTKVRSLLDRKLRGEVNVSVRLARDPQFSVWKGCVTWSFALPEDYRWSWERREGWFKRGADY